MNPASQQPRSNSQETSAYSSTGVATTNEVNLAIVFDFASFFCMYDQLKSSFI